MGQTIKSVIGTYKKLKRQKIYAHFRIIISLLLVLFCSITQIGWGFLLFFSLYFLLSLLRLNINTLKFQLRDQFREEYNLNNGKELSREEFDEIFTKDLNVEVESD